MRIGFFWQGLNGRYGHWNDGLRKAMDIISEKHDVKFFDITDDSVMECIRFNPDVVLYWEAPCTILGKDSDKYEVIRHLPFRKALLFAGGVIRKEWVEGFQLLFVESEINEQECEKLGIQWHRAFGVNTDIFKPLKKSKKATEKIYDGAMQATFADWKRHSLFAQSLGESGLAIGRKQEHDLNGYNECVSRGVKIVEEVKIEELPTLLSQAHVVVNTADFWGGGQRCTLEAMALGIPVVVMADSTKNVEYVRESGAGLICEPSPELIRQAIDDIKTKWSDEERARGIAYIQSRWTGQHYADALLLGIERIM